VCWRPPATEPEQLANAHTALASPWHRTCTVSKCSCCIGMLLLQSRHGQQMPILCWQNPDTQTCTVSKCSRCVDKLLPHSLNSWRMPILCWHATGKRTCTIKCQCCVAELPRILRSIGSHKREYRHTVKSENTATQSQCTASRRRREDGRRSIGAPATKPKQLANAHTVLASYWQLNLCS